MVRFSASGTCTIDVNSAAQGAYGAAAQAEQVLTVGAVLISTPPTPTYLAIYFVTAIINFRPTIDCDVDACPDPARIVFEPILFTGSSFGSVETEDPAHRGRPEQHCHCPRTNDECVRPRM